MPTDESQRGCGGSKAEDDVGGGGSGSKKNANEDLQNKMLEEELEKQRQQENAIVKLLVLGTGESGKSTVFKQMKILYSVPDPPAKFIMICRANLFSNAHTVTEGMKRLGISFKSPDGEEASKVIAAVPPDGNPDNITELKEPLKKMFADAGVQEAIERAAEYQLNDSTVYFWERADELCKADYMPTAQDVLRARVRTTGIVQQNFQIKDKKYTMFDVGGQRNERRKWIHCFDNVTAVIFVTAISEYDQVLYEDETTNRMDEALVLFEQICNHPSFKKTSMILFLNKRDLFDAKLKKKDMTCWRNNAELKAAGQDYDKCLTYIKGEFLSKNKEPELRQVYVHATCATDTSNISFVMESVFDIILKENLRKLAVGNVESMIELASGSGESGVASGKTIWTETPQGKIIVAACIYTKNLSESKVLVDESDTALLPAVQVQMGLSISTTDWEWIMGLGKKLPVLPTYENEAGSFRGDFKEAVKQLRTQLGVSDLGFVYDTPVQMTSKVGARTTIIPCVCKVPNSTEFPGYKWVEHEEFENACYKRFDNKDTDKSPCLPPDKNAEFNPFAPNPVDFRWFKGITLFEENVSKTPDKGVYLGVFKVLSSTDGFKIMVNEHNRISIPMIFLTENQLTPEEVKWMHGVRIREDQFKIDLLEGKQPNRGWLGPEMSGEEGATFPEKLWWAIDEAKARLDTENIGFQYDRELLFIDENNNIQLLLFGMLAVNESDVLAGHIWVSRDELEVQNMKYNCPVVLQAMLKETQGKVNKYQELASQEVADMDAMKKMREQKGAVKEEIEKLFESQQPLKWVNRVIMWCADKMPSFGKGIEGADAKEVVEKAMASNAEVEAGNKQRDAIIAKYMS
jgi:GTPase SAR1 family protein